MNTAFEIVAARRSPFSSRYSSESYQRCAVNIAVTIPVVRCPYCVSGDHFRPMTADGTGRYVCAKCGHLAVPGDQNFVCRNEVRRTANARLSARWIWTLQSRPKAQPPFGVLNIREDFNEGL